MFGLRSCWLGIEEHRWTAFMVWSAWCTWKVKHRIQAIPSAFAGLVLIWFSCCNQRCTSSGSVMGSSEWQVALHPHVGSRDWCDVKNLVIIVGSEIPSVMFGTTHLPNVMFGTTHLISELNVISSAFWYQPSIWAVNASQQG